MADYRLKVVQVQLAARPLLKLFQKKYPALCHFGELSRESSAATKKAIRRPFLGVRLLSDANKYWREQSYLA